MDVFSAPAFLFVTKVSPTGSAQVPAVKVRGLHFLTAPLQTDTTAVCRTAWHSHTKAFKRALYTTEVLGQPEVSPVTKVSPVSLSLVCHCFSGDKLGFQDSSYSKSCCRVAGWGWRWNRVAQVPVVGEAEVLMLSSGAAA